MKRFIIGTMLACSVSANAQEATAPDASRYELSKLRLQPKARSCFIGKVRCSVWHWGCPIRYKEREIVELGRNKYAELDVKPGRYILTNKTSSVQVEVGPGETQYVRCTIKMGMLTGRADLQYADKESFDKQAHEFEKKEPNFVPE